jgi:hypothetical protein
MKKKTALVLLNEHRDELIIYVRTDSKDPYIYMRFEYTKTVQAIYHTLKKAASLRYDYGFDRVKIEINGTASSEMSCVTSTKLEIN